MSQTDPIADLLTRIGTRRPIRKKEVMIPSSKLKIEVAKILKEEGYIRNFKVDRRQQAGDPEHRPQVRDDNQSVISGSAGSAGRAAACSAPGTPSPRSWTDWGIAIISTSKGMHDGQEMRGPRESAERSSAISGESPRKGEPEDVESRTEADRGAGGSEGDDPCRQGRIRVLQGKARLAPVPGDRGQAGGPERSSSRRDEDSKSRNARTTAWSRSLANNALLGVTVGFSKQLEIVGVGYRAKLEKDGLELSLGYSKPVLLQDPGGYPGRRREADADHGQRDRQTAGRAGGRGDQALPQARPLQAQGRPVRRRAPDQERTEGGGGQCVRTISETKKEGQGQDPQADPGEDPGTAARPRVFVFKSNRYVYAQAINDGRSAVLASACTLEKAFKEQDKNTKNKDACGTAGSRSWPRVSRRRRSTDRLRQRHLSLSRPDQDRGRGPEERRPGVLSPAGEALKEE